MKANKLTPQEIFEKASSGIDITPEEREVLRRTLSHPESDTLTGKEKLKDSKENKSRVGTKLDTSMGGYIPNVILPTAKTGIHIKPENKGKFTASAKRAGQSVQEHAKSVLGNPNATPLQKKRANFARNFGGQKKENGGNIPSADSAASYARSNMDEFAKGGYLPIYKTRNGKQPEIPTKKKSIAPGRLMQFGGSTNRSADSVESYENLKYEVTRNARKQYGGKVISADSVVKYENGSEEYNNKGIEKYQKGKRIPINQYQSRLDSYIREGLNPQQQRTNYDDSKGPTGYGFKYAGNNLSSNLGLEMDMMNNKPNMYGGLGYNGNNFNANIEHKRGLGTKSTTGNLGYSNKGFNANVDYSNEYGKRFGASAGYHSPNVNVNASYVHNNNRPELGINAGINNNNFNANVDYKYGSKNHSLDTNIGYNNDKFNANVGYGYNSGKNTVSGNVGYNKGDYNFNVSGEKSPDNTEFRVGLNKRLGSRPVQQTRPIELPKFINEEKDVEGVEEAAYPIPKAQSGDYINGGREDNWFMPTKLFLANRQKGGDIPTIEDEGEMVDMKTITDKEKMTGPVVKGWRPNWKKMTAQARKLNAKTVRTNKGSIIYFNDDWSVKGVDESGLSSYQEGGQIVVIDGKEYNTNSPEYRSLYNQGQVVSVDSEGLPYVQQGSDAAWDEYYAEKKQRENPYNVNFKMQYPGVDNTRNVNSNSYNDAPEYKKPFEYKPPVYQPTAEELRKRKGEDAVRAGTGKFATGVAQGAGAMFMGAGEIASTPIAVGTEFLSGRGDYTAAYPNPQRILSNVGVGSYDGNYQQTPGSLVSDNPFISTAIDLPIDIITGRAVDKYGNKVMKYLSKNRMPEELGNATAAGFNFKLPKSKDVVDALLFKDKSILKNVNSEINTLRDNQIKLRQDYYDARKNILNKSEAGVLDDLMNDEEYVKLLNDEKLKKQILDENEQRLIGLETVPFHYSSKANRLQQHIDNLNYVSTDPEFLALDDDAILPIYEYGYGELSKTPLTKAEYLRKTREKISEYQSLSKNELNKKIVFSDQKSPGVISSENSGFDKVVSTGQGQVVNFRTGEVVNHNVVLPNKKVMYTKGDKGLQTDIISNVDNPIVDDRYIQTQKSNINMIETELAPGSKAFGSSVGVTEAGLPHVSDDIDLLITQSDLYNIPNGKFKGQNGPAAKYDLFDGKHGEKGVFDFNVIHENPDGTVRPVIQRNGKSLEIELFRQFFPDEFFEQSKISLQTGKPIKIPLTSKQLIGKVDGKIKTIVDSYEAGANVAMATHKQKHVLRPDAYVNFGNPEVVQQGQSAYVKSIVGSKGTMGHQFDPEHFSNIERNKETLRQINFIGNIDKIAEDPQRMQLALNDFYINKSIFSREVGSSTNTNTIQESLTNWDPQRKGAGASRKGLGLNVVELGDPDHLARSSDNTILGHMQIDLSPNTNNPLDYVISINRKTKGSSTLDQEQKNILNEIITTRVPKENITNKQYDTYNDVINIPFKNDQHEIYGPDQMHFDMSRLPFKPNDILNEISDKLGIVAVSTDAYGNSNYASLLKKFDEKTDNMIYSLKEIALIPKSNKERIEAYQKLSPSGKMRVIDSIKELDKTLSLINGGIYKSRERYASLVKKMKEIKAQAERVYAEKLNIDMAAVENNYNTLQRESMDMQNSILALQERAFTLESIRKQSAMVIIGAGGTLGATVLANEVKNVLTSEEYAKKEQEKYDRMLERQIKKDARAYKTAYNTVIPAIESSGITGYPKRQAGGFIASQYPDHNAGPSADSASTFNNIGRNYSRYQEGGEITQYKNGGQKDPTINCSKCGWSWKVSNAGSDALTCHKCGSTNNKIEMKNGGQMIKRADGSYSQRGLWDNIRANAGSGKEPTKQMLEQERKIKAQKGEYIGSNYNPMSFQQPGYGVRRPEKFSDYTSRETAEVVGEAPEWLKKQRLLALSKQIQNEPTIDYKQMKPVYSTQDQSTRPNQFTHVGQDKPYLGYQEATPFNNTLAWNALEFLDPSGVTSYPDVYQAWSDGKFDYHDIVEPLSALPGVGYFGKFSKGIKNAKPYGSLTKIPIAADRFDTVDDVYNDNVKPIFKNTEGFGPGDVKKKLGGNLTCHKCGGSIKMQTGGRACGCRHKQDGGKLPCHKCGGAHGLYKMCNGGMVQSFDVIDEQDVLAENDSRRFATKENSKPVGFKYSMMKINRI